MCLICVVRAGVKQFRLSDIETMPIRKTPTLPTMNILGLMFRRIRSSCISSKDATLISGTLGQCYMWLTCLTQIIMRFKTIEIWMSELRSVYT